MCIWFFFCVTLPSVPPQSVIYNVSPVIYLQVKYSLDLRLWLKLDQYFLIVGTQKEKHFYWTTSENQINKTRNLTIYHHGCPQEEPEWKNFLLLHYFINVWNRQTLNWLSINLNWMRGGVLRDIRSISFWYFLDRKKSWNLGPSKGISARKRLLL